MKFRICFILMLSFFSLNALSEDYESIQAGIKRLYDERQYKEAADYAVQNLGVVEKQFGPKSSEYANYLSTIGGLHAFAGNNAEANKYFLRGSSVRQMNRLPQQPAGIGTDGYAHMLRSRGAIPAAREQTPQQHAEAPRSFADLNRDGICDNEDIVLFDTAVNTADKAIADFNRDGSISPRDREIFAQFWKSCNRAKR